MERTVDILIEISIYSAVITAFILLFRAVFKKRISPKVQYAMWLLLVLRLMLPVTIESGFHVESLLPERPAPVVQEESIFDSPVINEMPAVNMAPATEVAPVQPDIDAQGENAVSPVISQEISESAVAAVPEVKEPVIDINWRIAAFWTWAAGAMAFCLWLMIVKLRFYEDMHGGLTSVSPRVYAIYDECCAALNVKPITMWTVDRAISPGIAFFTYPVLLLPASMDGDEEKLRYAFLHELTHKKRHDHHMTALLTALRIIYWFNPAVHIGFSEMRADMETACDAEVIAFVGREQKRGYLTAILELFSYATRPQLGMSQASSRRMAKRRMKGAFMRERTTFLGRAAALMLALVMLAGCFTTACQSAPVEAEPAPEELAPVTEVETEEPITNPDEVQTYKWSESYLAAGSVKVNVDAELDIPVNANYPVYQVEYSEFTKENLRKITDAVIGEVSDVELKVDYSQGYLDMGDITEAYLEENRPTEAEISPYSKYYCKDEHGIEWEIVTGLRNVVIEPKITADHIIEPEELIMEEETERIALDNVKITKETAVQIAQEAINNVGIPNAELYRSQKARLINYDSNETITEGWRLDYVYRYGELTSNCTAVSRTTYKPFERIVEPLRYEQLSMFVDETGIVHYESTTPSCTTATINDTRTPLTFEETKASIKSVIEDIAYPWRAYPAEYELNILGISLCSCIVQSEYNSHTGYMIPTWMIGISFGIPGDMATRYSQLFISAIDGTQISDRYMTENGRRIAQEYDSGMYASKTITPEDADLRDAILRLYPLADEIAAKGFTAVSGEGWLEESKTLFQTMGLRLGGAGMTGADYLGYTIETPDEYCSNDLCHMYAAVLFASVPNLYEINIGNADFITYNTYLDKEHEQLLATAVGDVISREDAEKHWAGLTKPLEEYGTSGSGIRELLRELANLGGINLASAGDVQDTPLHVSLLQPTPVPVINKQQAAAEAFLTMYFDKMCDRDSDLDFCHNKDSAQNGQLLLTADNYNDMMLLRQWIDYKDMLADFGYDIEKDCGRFVSLDIQNVEGGKSGEYVLKGYLKTTAFGTVVEMDMVDAGGKYAITSVEFPDWKEYSNFCNDFAAFMKSKGYTDYGKSSYIDAKRKEREEFEKAISSSFAFSDAIVGRAEKLVEKKYEHGSYGPETFDSAGFVYYVLFNEGVEVTKQSCQEYSQIDSWKKIEDKADLQPGDILFFYGDDLTKINHAGIYIGDNKMIDASASYDKVTERSCNTDYWQEHFAFARRVA